jgi:hypothetical protein
MSIAHDSYLFDPDRVGEALQDSLAVLRSDRPGYQALRAQALDLFDRSERVRWFAGEYGGWGRPQILEEIPADEPETASDIAFWLMMTVYDHLVKPQGEPIGLGPHWRVLPTILAACDWSVPDVTGLIYGRSFVELPVHGVVTRDESASARAAVVDVLARLNPHSAGGRAGWLSLHDAEGYRAKLSGARSRIEAFRGLPGVALEPNVIDQAIRSATAMVEAAVAHRVGLCQILSG